MKGVVSTRSMRVVECVLKRLGMVLGRGNNVDGAGAVQSAPVLTLGA
jgi:hypothetical protein